MLGNPTHELPRAIKEALTGTSGSPSSSNKFVTDLDSRVHPATQTVTGLMSKEDKIKLDALTTSEGEPEILNSVDKFQLLNLFRALFDANSEILLIPENTLLNTVFYDMFIDSSKIESMTNIQMMGNRAQLAIQGSYTLFDDCEDLTGINGAWTSYTLTTGVGTSSIATSPDWKTTGTNSIKVSFSAREFHDIYGMVQTLTNKDWTAYSGIVADFKCNVPGMMVCAQVRQNNSWQTVYATSLDGVGNNLNVVMQLPSSRSTIRGIRIGFYNTDYMGAGFGYIDNIRFITGSATPAASGSIVTTTRTYTKDIIDVIVTDKRTFPTETGSITLDISLDGGTHWKSNVSINNLHLTYSGGLLETADGGVAWNNKRNLKLRYNIVRGSDNVSPVLDDYVALVSRG